MNDHSVQRRCPKLRLLEQEALASASFASGQPVPAATTGVYVGCMWGAEYLEVGRRAGHLQDAVVLPISAPTSGVDELHSQRLLNTGNKRAKLVM